MTQNEIIHIRRKARTHLRRAQRLAAESSSPLKGMSEEQVIQTLRETRERLWEEKLADSSRQQRVHLRTGTY